MNKYKLAFLFVLQYYRMLSSILRLFAKKSPQASGVLYLSAFFPENSGYHWRAKKWADELQQYGIQANIMHALEEHEYYSLLKQNHTKFLMHYLRKRFWQVVNSRKFEIVIVRRELLLFNDYGNLFLEKLLLKIHPNAILDFDDDLSAAKSQPKTITNRYARILGEHGDKFNETLKRYNKFIVASGYLKNRIMDQNKKAGAESICVIPTCVDYDRYPPKEYPVNFEKLTFGWIGGDHNYYLLDLILPILDLLSETYTFKLLIIGGTPYHRQTKFEIEFRKWDLRSEVENLYAIDIGLMPLTNDSESMGKGGFKLIQYMGLGIVSIASPVTINKEIISNGIDSLLAMSSEEWKIAFEKVLSGEIDLVTMGKSARQKIERNYTFNAKKKLYLEFIERVRNSRNMV